MSESTQHQLDRVRPPRVQITYDVEIGDAFEKKELPLVAGIMADLSGKRDADKPMPPLKQRKFVEIDRDNFDGVMKSISPRLAFNVPNRITDEDVQMGVNLTFSKLEDFDPVAVLKQVEPLRKLFEARQRLSDLATKLDGNDNLDRLLRDVMANTDEFAKLKPAPADPAPAPEA